MLRVNFGCAVAKYGNVTVKKCSQMVSFSFIINAPFLSLLPYLDVKVPAGSVSYR